MKQKQARMWLKIAFLTGAIIDGAMIPLMLIPALARIFWGFDASGNLSYQFAMIMGAALMLGWTLLLIWAYRKPIERRGVAFFTIVVILGIAAANIYAFVSGLIPATASSLYMSWVMQLFLLTIFCVGYFGSGKAK
ncbi:hypothetical protein JXM67_11900 [candidate division WOR-3 bacterium]|nr:hypothetical protein [candidate division WOR-3 bacterium]